MNSKKIASLLGLAIGDAIGATVEFLPRGRFKPLTDMIGGGKFQLEKGQWTDDTSMALCLADSLIACQGFDANDKCNVIVVGLMRVIIPQNPMLLVLVRPF